MLKTQQISQPDGFGSILAQRSTSNKLSAGRQRAPGARQQSMGGYGQPIGEFESMRTSGDMKVHNDVNQPVSEQRRGQVAEGSPICAEEEAAATGGNKRKHSALAGHNRGRRHLVSVPKHSDISEEQPATVESSTDESKSDKDPLLKDGENATKPESPAESESEADKKPFKMELVWRNIILFIILHSSLPIGFYMLFTQRPWLTLAYSILGMYASGLGVTGGTHRLWSHRSYKASWPVQFLLMALQTMAGQNSIYTWSRDHRVHHKFSETDADPHNIKRGFFFAHMGWLCCKKHPDVKEKGKLIDMSDLEANPLVMFQHRHFWWLSALFTVLVPTMVPVLLWGERFWTSFVFSFMIRYLITLHGTWLVNSAAHYYGSRPYDVKIEARESPYVIYNGLGEGFHNYHHTFPYDYATSEFGKYFNITTAFIDLCALLGLAQDRRKVDQETIMKRRLRTGDLDGLDGSLDQPMKVGEAVKAKLLANGASDNKLACRKSAIQRSIDELEESGLVERSELSNPLAPLSNIIHELPYISGLTSMKYTM